MWRRGVPERYCPDTAVSRVVQCSLNLFWGIIWLEVLEVWFLLLRHLFPTALVPLLLFCDIHKSCYVTCGLLWLWVVAVYHLIRLGVYFPSVQ